MFQLNAVPKPQHRRRTPRKAARGAFSKKTRQSIIERDRGLCVRCGARYEEIHHVIYRSHNGAGTEDNGVCVCHACHELAHSKEEVRRWFEHYRKVILLREEVGPCHMKS
ncbi:HNH endonuclease [Paenibacillus sambharensis]